MKMPTKDWEIMNMDIGFGLIPSFDIVHEARKDSLKILEFVKKN